MTRIRPRRVAPALAGIAVLAAALGLAVLAPAANASPSTVPSGTSTGSITPTTPLTPVRADGSRASCATPAGGRVRCLSEWKRFPASSGWAPAAAVAARQVRAARPPQPESGIGPVDLRTLYHVPKLGADTVVGIVDAYDNPRAEKDLATYRSAWKLGACTTANGCFRKVDQRGGTDYPEGDVGWGVEIALDVQAVSAACPTCKILLVEADDDSFEAIGQAVATAVRLGAEVVSNSYGADEFGRMTDYGKKYYTHPGVPIVAASGDYGFTTASFPAVLPSTIAAGGTYLTTKGSSFTETAWEWAGSGCSAWIPKPAVQKDENCSLRTVSDVSAMADSEEGFAVYDTYGLGEDNGWIAVAGTSLSAPLISGWIGLAGVPSKVASPAYLYQHTAGLKDVVGGSNGSCGKDYLCTGLKGYDGPTGLGSPRGLAAFGG